VSVEHAILSVRWRRDQRRHTSDSGWRDDRLPTSFSSPPLGAGRRPTRYTEPRRRLEILRFQLSGGRGEEQQDDPSGIGWRR
jgi:hypothetical protein